MGLPGIGNAASADSASHFRRLLSAGAPSAFGTSQDCSPELDTVSPPRKRKRKACTECRQAKLRCEFPSTGPCDRCRKRNINCFYDADFKRVNQKAQLRNLVQRVQTLQATGPSHGLAFTDAAGAKTGSHHGQSHCAAGDTDSPMSDGNARSTMMPALNHSQNTARANVNEEIPLEDHFTASSFGQIRSAQFSQTLEHLDLSAKQIDRFFDLFFSRCHPFFPLLDLYVDPDTVHSRSPLLFWTLIVIAARRDDEDPTLLSALVPCVRRLLWLTVGTPPHSRLDVKAMVLLCMWPLANSSMSTDSTYILASAVKSSAIHIGLHRPQYIQDFSRVRYECTGEDLQDVRKIWICCFIAAECCTSAIGQPSLFLGSSHFPDLITHGHDGDLPDEIAFIFRLVKFSHRIHTYLSRERSGRVTPEAGSSMIILMLEDEYDELRQDLQTGLSARQQILLKYVSLQLCSYYFFEKTSLPARKPRILRGYAISLQVISALQEQHTHSQLLSYSPSLFLSALYLAMMFILKIAQSSYAEFVDVSEGKEIFNQGLHLVKVCSVEDNDLPGRFSKILGQLWRAPAGPAGSNQPEPTLRVTSRLGGSVLHDTLWKWRETFGGQAGSRESLSMDKPITSTESLYDNNLSVPTVSTASTGKGTNEASVYDDSVAGGQRRTFPLADWSAASKVTQDEDIRNYAASYGQLPHPATMNPGDPCLYNSTDSVDWFLDARLPELMFADLHSV